MDLGQVTAGDDDGGLVVDTALEIGRAPEFDGTLGLEGGNSGVDVLDWGRRHHGTSGSQPSMY